MRLWPRAVKASWSFGAVFPVDGETFSGAGGRHRSAPNRRSYDQRIELAVQPAGGGLLARLLQPWREHVLDRALPDTGLLAAPHEPLRLDLVRAGSRSPTAWRQSSILA